MPSMTAPLFGPSATVTSRAFGDLDGSSFCVAAWITSSPFLTVYLSASKVTVITLNSAAGTSLPPASTDSNVQVPWNFLSSFSTSALSPARPPVPPDAVSTRVQSSVTSAIRIRVLLHLHLTTMVSLNDPAQQPGPPRARRSRRPSTLPPARGPQRTPTRPGRPPWLARPGKPARTRGTLPPAAPAVGGTGSGRTRGSRGRPGQLGGGVRQAGPDVLGGQFWEVGEQFIDSHPASEVLEHVPDGDPHAADARLAAPLARLDSDEVRVVHTHSLPARRCTVNERRARVPSRPPNASAQPPGPPAETTTLESRKRGPVRPRRLVR